VNGPKKLPIRFEVN